jgi:hypothetical protein
VVARFRSAGPSESLWLVQSIRPGSIKGETKVVSFLCKLFQS